MLDSDKTLICLQADLLRLTNPNIALPGLKLLRNKSY